MTIIWIKTKLAWTYELRTKIIKTISKKTHLYYKKKSAFDALRWLPSPCGSLCSPQRKNLLAFLLLKTQKSLFCSRKIISPCGSPLPLLVPCHILYHSPPLYGIFLFLFGRCISEIPLSKLIMALTISIDLIKETC